MLRVSVYFCTCVDYVLYHIDVFIEISSFKEALTDQSFGVFDSPLPMSDMVWRRRWPFPALWHSVGVWRTLSHYPQSCSRRRLKVFVLSRHVLVSPLTYRKNHAYYSVSPLWRRCMYRGFPHLSQIGR